MHKSLTLRCNDKASLRVKFIAAQRRPPPAGPRDKRRKQGAPNQFINVYPNALYLDADRYRKCLHLGVHLTRDGTPIERPPPAPPSLSALSIEHRKPINTNCPHKYHNPNDRRRVGYRAGDIGGNVLTSVVYLESRVPLKRSRRPSIRIRRRVRGRRTAGARAVPPRAGRRDPIAGVCRPTCARTRRYRAGARNRSGSSGPLYEAEYNFIVNNERKTGVHFRFSFNAGHLYFRAGPPRPGAGGQR
ncbi:hypothetical protein EVAR_66015_1 [Eumeta japonica]|uniref:Uncharacterized protein n=1 Tax=Eumeta variegata TaxID=151549 RepID=A0A4C1Z8N3_EUMVA|nr:hypothetical protein EVAR_66015_1 [Eumeta japonica]